jgi:hypothetical protein
MISFCLDPIIIALWYAFSQNQTTQEQTTQEQTIQVQTIPEQTTQEQTIPEQTTQKQPILDTVLDEIRSVYEILANLTNFNTLKKARFEIRRVCKILLKVNAKIIQELDEIRQTRQTRQTLETLDMVRIMTRSALYTLTNARFETIDDVYYKIREVRRTLNKILDTTRKSV